MFGLDAIRVLSRAEDWRTLDAFYIGIVDSFVSAGFGLDDLRAARAGRLVREAELWALRP